MASANEGGVKQAKEETKNNSEQNLSKAQNNSNPVSNETSNETSNGNGIVQNTISTAQDFISEKAGQLGTIAQQTYGKAYDKASDLSARATDTLGSSVDYVKNIDVQKARETVKSGVKQQPELSIAIAAIAGLLIGLVIGSRKK